MYKSNLLNPFLIIPALLIVMLFVNSCKESVTEPAIDTLTTVTLSGQVIDKVSGALLDSAYIMVKSDTEEKVGVTDNQGKYQIDVKVFNNKNVVVTAMKSGYLSDSTSVNATASINSVSILKLEPLSVVVGPTGSPASITLFSQTSTSIGVKESGSPETVDLIFEIKDSTGKNINPNWNVTANFIFGAHPDGGEFLLPSAKVNNFGQVLTTLTSGTKSGVVQVIAEVNYNGKIIRSRPVAIAIYGGLPNVDHFSIAFGKLNFPGYNISGLTNSVTAYVGDRYANPVRPGTIVYFTSTGGIIEGSASTNNIGIGTVNLVSADPRPTHQEFGPGFATVTASTGDENNNTISSSGVVLFSGYPVLSINPSTFEIPNLGSQSFDITVSDQNNNPLSGGTTIAIKIDGKDMRTYDKTSITLPDTQDKFWTHFEFTVADTNKTDELRRVSVTISVNGPNGNIQNTVVGSSR